MINSLRSIFNKLKLRESVEMGAVCDAIYVADACDNDCDNCVFKDKKSIERASNKLNILNER